jgi:hypothetical protein
LPLLPLLANILQPPAHLILDREVLCSLERRHEGRERPLLLFHEIEPAPLNPKRVIKERRHLVLVCRIPGEHLATQRHPHLTLLAKEPHALALDTVVHLAELTHLRIAQVQPPTNDLGEPLAELPIQWRAWGSPLLRRSRGTTIDALRRDVARNARN